MKLALLLSVGSSLLPAAASAQAERQVVERVVAVVNDEAVFLSDLRRRAVPFLEQAMAADTQTERMARLEQLYGQMLDVLVDEELIQQAARRMEVRVSSADVERAIRNVRGQSGLGEEDFWEAVRGQGFTEAQYRTDLRRQLLRLKVLNTRARGRVNITEEDVRARYQQLVRETNRDTCFEVSMRLFQVAEDASATEVAVVREEAEVARSSVTAATFDDEGGVDLGNICRGELNPTLDEAIAGMQAGQISDPVRGPNGYYILHLRRRAQRAGAVPPFEQARDQLYRQMLEVAMARQEEIYLEELRDDAVLDRRL